jgi:hypothetical protein
MVVDVLGHRLGGHPTDLLEGLDPHQRVGAAPEGRLPAILAGQNGPVEQRLLVEPVAGGGAAVLERLQVVEVLGGLDQRHPWVVEVAEGVDQVVGPGDVVGVQHRHDIRFDDPQGVVEVPGLGVAAVAATQVAGAEVTSQPGDLRPVPVVQDPGLVHRLQGDRGRDGRCQHLRRFVPGRDQHRHPQRTLPYRPCPGSGVDIPEREHIQPEADCRVQLQDVQRDRQPPHRQVDGGQPPPD